MGFGLKTRCIYISNQAWLDEYGIKDHFYITYKQPNQSLSAFVHSALFLVLCSSLIKSEMAIANNNTRAQSAQILTALVVL